MSGVKKLLSSSGSSQSQADQNIDSFFDVSSYTNQSRISGNPYDVSLGGHLMNTYSVGAHKRLETGVDLRGSSSLESDQYFSSVRYDGTGYPREFDIGIDLANNHSMTWIRGLFNTTTDGQDTTTIDSNLRGGMFDSVRGGSKIWCLNFNSGQRVPLNDPNWFQYTTNGFRIGYGEGQSAYDPATWCNTRGIGYMAWTWRVKEKFFDIVTYTGDGTLNRQIAHSLGSEPKFMFIKSLDQALDAVHWNLGNGTTAMSTWPGSMVSGPSGTSAGSGYSRYPRTSAGSTLTGDAHVNLGNGSQVVVPTSTHFTVGSAPNATSGSFGTFQENLTNGNGKNYVAYLWGDDDSSSSLQRIQVIGSGSGTTSQSFGTPQFIWNVGTGGTGNTNSQNFLSAVTDKKMGNTVATRFIKGPETHNRAEVRYAANRVLHLGFVDRNTSGTGLGANGGIEYYPNASNPMVGSGLQLASLMVLDPKNVYDNANDNHGLIFISNRRRYTSLATGLPTNTNTLNISGARFRNDTRIYSTLDPRRSGSLLPYSVLRNYRSFTGDTGSSSFSWDGSGDNTTGIQYFDKTGMGLGDEIQTTKDGRFVAVTIKKASKFVDMFTYTGNGSTTYNRQIPHNLGVSPAMIWIRARSPGNQPTFIWHKDLPNYFGLVEFETPFKNTAGGSSSAYQSHGAYPLYGNEMFGGTAGNLGTPTEDYIVVNGDSTNNFSSNANTHGLNVNGNIYEVFLFADQPTTGNIATGSYIGNGQALTSYPSGGGGNNYITHYGANPAGVNIDLGWEPQFVMIKAMTTGGEWIMLDTTRGWDRHETNVLTLSRRNANAPVSHIFDREYTHNHANIGFPHARGFEVRGTGVTNRVWSGETQEWSKNWNKSGERYLYFAVRRPRKVPTAGNQVFACSRGSYDQTVGYATNQVEQKDIIHLGQPATGVNQNSGVQGNSKAMGTTAFKAYQNMHNVPMKFKPDVVIVSNVNHPNPASSPSHNLLFSRLTGKAGFQLGQLGSNPIYENNSSNQGQNYNPFDGDGGWGEIDSDGELNNFYAKWTNNPNPSGGTSKSQMFAMMLQRAPGFMDVTVDKIIGQSGILSNPGDVLTTKHNLQVVPEMIISKVFRLTIHSNYVQNAPGGNIPEQRWLGFDVRHKDMTNGLDDRMMINAGWGAWDHAMNPHGNNTYNYGGYYADSSQSQSNTITSSGYGTDAQGSHTIGTVTASNSELVYTGVDGTAGNISTPGGQMNFYVQRIMFASLSGISKVGYYLGTGSTDVNVNCGFSGGARFVLIKREDAAGNWYMFDAGNSNGNPSYQSILNSSIATGNDAFTVLNQGHAQKTTVDVINPYSQGFSIPANSYTNGSIQYSSSVAAAPININGARYIFLAIA